ncbi:MAG: LysR family transcriptional regulator [Devosia sp.]|nr:LysR family transcriptional regulator [Devosia sp.]
MEFRQLLHLLAVIEAGSLGKAAKIVGVSEPALSKSIKRLEDRVGAKLFERSALGVVPTAFGRELEKHAKVIKAEVEHAYHALGSLAGLNEGLIRVGTDASFTTYLLPTAITALRAKAPGIRVIVERAPPEELMTMVVHGVVDFITVSLPTVNLDANLEASVLMEDQSRLLVRRDHPLTHETKITPEKLMQYQWVLPPEDHYMRRKIKDILARLGQFSPDVAIESDNVQLTKHCLIESDLIGFLPSQYSFNYGNLAVLTPLDIPELQSADRLGVVKRRRAILSPGASSLLGALRDAADVLATLPDENLPAGRSAGSKVSSS